MVTSRTNAIWSVLHTVPDPEIPVISVVDLGIIRSVSESDHGFLVQITPTYSGCPATKVIEESVIDALKHADLGPFEVETILSPAWSTSMISVEGRQKLLDYGIAPPASDTSYKLALMGEPRHIPCPRCASLNTKMVSQFGSTPCKAHFRCNDCLEPFDYFKCL